MQTWKLWCSTLALLFVTLAGPATAATVRWDYDRETDFSRWQYLAWATPVGAEATMEERRIARAVEAGFAARGYVLAADTTRADFVLVARAGAWQDVHVEAQPYGPLRGRSARLEREARGALWVQVYDRRTGRLAWHGVVADALASDPAQADKRTARAVAKLLAHFPARGGAR